MKQKINASIEIPEGIDVKIDKNNISVKGPEGCNEKNIEISDIEFEIKNNAINISRDKSTKREKKRINTIIAHIKNMISGVQKKYEYTLKICFNHFPFTVDINNNKAVIKNFLGEKVNRSCKIIEGADVSINKEIIIVSSTDKEKAGQTATNFENATKVRGRDRRVFQDGIFLTNKNGVAI